MKAGFDSTSGFAVYKRLLAGMLIHWRHLAVAVLGMVFFAGADTGFAALMKPMLDGSFVDRDPVYIRWIPVAMLTVFLLRGVGYFLSAYYMAYVGRSVVKELRKRLFDQLLHMPVSFFDATTSGTLISKLTYNAEQVTQTATRSLTVVVRDSLTILGLVGWMFYINWFLTLCFLTVGPVIAFSVAIVSRRLRKLSARIQRSMGSVTDVVQEMIEGHKVVKSFGGQAFENARFEKANERNMAHQMKLVAVDSATSPAIQFIAGLALVGIITLSTVSSVLESITVGTFVSFIVAMVLLLRPIRDLTKINATVQRGIAAAQSIYELLESEREQDESRGNIGRVRGEIEFRNIRFQYDPAKGDVIKDLCMSVTAGSTVALVGRSGSGKSTLLNLLPRFYDPQSGEILIDGNDTREIALADLRDQIAYVSQDVVLFNATIAENIAYGLKGEIDRGKLEEAARAAHAFEFVNGLPQGFDTLIGQHGVLLSGGQRQRIAIARALLRDAPILLMDEATSSLDSEAERHIQDALQALLENRTTLVIAHRLSTVEHADKIVVMDQGRIVETGTHSELIVRNGQYSQLYRTQFRAGLPPVRAVG